MNKAQLINRILELTDDKGVDKAEYQEYLSSKPVDDLSDIFERKCYWKNDRAIREVAQLVREMNRGGMFDLGQMKPENALD